MISLSLMFLPHHCHWFVVLSLSSFSFGHITVIVLFLWYNYHRFTSKISWSSLRFYAIMVIVVFLWYVFYHRYCVIFMLSPLLLHFYHSIFIYLFYFSLRFSVYLFISWFSLSFLLVCVYLAVCWHLSLLILVLFLHVYLFTPVLASDWLKLVIWCIILLGTFI